MSVSGNGSSRDTRSLIDKANAIPFAVILNLPRGDRPQQLRCPFGREKHAHGDASRSARYYKDTNKIFCFTEGKAWRPTDFVAEKMKVSQEEAAIAILRKFAGGTEKERTREHRLNRLSSAVCTHVEEDRSALFIALEESLPAGSLVREQIGDARTHLEEALGVDCYEYAKNLAEGLEEFKRELLSESAEEGQ